MKIEVSSRRLGRAWAATQIVAPDDSGRPVPDRAALVEMFDGHGMRLVSTDSYVLVRAWVPFDDEADNLEPELDELPDSSFIVADPDHRGWGLLKYISKLYKKELDENLVPKVILSRQTDVGDDQGVFEGLEAETLRMEWPDHEEIVLPLVEGTFPEWCKVQNEHCSEATGSSSFTSLTLGSLAKLCEIYKGYTIDWKLGGDLGVIDWKLGPLWGQLMQARAQEPEPKNDDELTEPR
jgi:hypothetical protein